MADPRKVTIPDLVSHSTFPLRTNRHCALVASASKQWLFRYSGLSVKMRQSFHGLKAGRLTAMCYPFVGAPQLRVCSDFMNYLFHLDNLSDDMDVRSTVKVADVVMNALYHPHKMGEGRIGRMTTNYWRRLITTASPGAQARFIETFDFFFQAVAQQARDRATGVVPDLESYIELRRDTSGCKPCWALIEYANNLDIPDEVMEHPILQSLGQAANDLVTWSNDIFSYKVEQSRGDTHNMIPVIMRQNGVSVQDAIDIVGEMCKQSIDRFNADRELLPSWGSCIDKQVKVYVDGLADWIVGSLHWSFESERYFGKEGMTVKKTRIVEFIPPPISPTPPPPPVSPLPPALILHHITPYPDESPTNVTPLSAKRLNPTSPGYHFARLPCLARLATDTISSLTHSFIDTFFAASWTAADFFSRVRSIF